MAQLCLFYNCKYYNNIVILFNTTSIFWLDIYAKSTRFMLQLDRQIKLAKKTKIILHKNILALVSCSKTSHQKNNY